MDMKKSNRQEKAFRLDIFERDNNEYGLSLYQLPVNGAVREDNPILVSKIWGSPLDNILDMVLQEIRAAGYGSVSFHKKNKKPYILSEESGVRLGLLFISTKPLKKRERIEQIKDAIQTMALEEVYYWYSRCRYQNNERSCRAFRILFSDE